MESHTPLFLPHPRRVTTTLPCFRSLVILSFTTRGRARTFPFLTRYILISLTSYTQFSSDQCVLMPLPSSFVCLSVSFILTFSFLSNHTALILLPRKARPIVLRSPCSRVITSVFIFWEYIFSVIMLFRYFTTHLFSLSFFLFSQPLFPFYSRFSIHDQRFDFFFFIP